MKKPVIAIFIFFLFVSSVFCADVLWDESDDDDPFREKGPLRIPNRIFEIGYDANVGFSNNYFSIKEIFQYDVTLNIDELVNGFKFNLDFGVVPFFLNINNMDKWGFGLHTNIDFAGVLALSQDMLLFSETKESKSDFNGTAFLEAGINTFFNIGSFKVHFNPSAFMPLIYMKTDISYTFENVEKGTILDIIYNMNVFTPFPINDFDNLPKKPTAKPGFDFDICIEYPMSTARGFNRSFLTFDVGLDFLNIPIYPSTVKDYMFMTGRMGSNEPVDIIDDGFDKMFSSFDFGEPEYGVGEERVTRPFIMHTWINWRPLGRQVITIKPLIGFSVNPIYSSPFNIDAGLSLIFDLMNMFVFGIGVNYIDRIWQNSFNFKFNCRVFEYNIGVNLRSQEFANSWKAKGLGLNVGMKFGW